MAVYDLDEIGIVVPACTEEQEDRNAAATRALFTQMQPILTGVDPLSQDANAYPGGPQIYADDLLALLGGSGGYIWGSYNGSSSAGVSAPFTPTDISWSTFHQDGSNSFVGDISGIEMTLPAIGAYLFSVSWNIRPVLAGAPVLAPDPNMICSGGLVFTSGSGGGVAACVMYSYNGAQIQMTQSGVLIVTGGTPPKVKAQVTISSAFSSATVNSSGWAMLFLGDYTT